MVVESSEESEAEEKGRQSAHHDDDDDEVEEGEEEEEEDKEEEEEEDSIPKSGKVDRKRKKRECSQGERAVMVSARLEVIGKKFPVKKTAGKTSAIWKWFTRVHDEEGKLFAVTCICGGKWSFQAGWGNGHLARHASKCSTVLRAKGQTISAMADDEEDNEDCATTATTGEVAPSAPSDGGGDGLTQSTLRFEKHTKKLLALPSSR